MSSRRRRRTDSNSEVDKSASHEPAPAALSTMTSTSMMNCRDRTHEFLTVVKSLQSTQANGAPKFMKLTDLKAARTEFTIVSKQISKDLANTFAKLEKLTTLAKRKSLFDDKEEEIQQLTFIIKQDLTALNKQIAHLQEVSRTQRSQNGHHKQTHSNAVVVALQSKLATMSGDFKSVLEVRTESLKLQKSRRDEFSQSSTVAPSLPTAMLQGRSGGSVLLEDDAKGDNEVVINMDGVMARQQQLHLLDQQDSYIQSRTETMRNIEQTIVELGSIFQQLAHMVKEQEEIVQRIDSNVESTHVNIEAAHSELVKYFQSVTSNRWLMLKIFGVILVFFLVFVVFIA